MGVKKKTHARTDPLLAHVAHTHTHSNRYIRTHAAAYLCTVRVHFCSETDEPARAIGIVLANKKQQQQGQMLTKQEDYGTDPGLKATAHDAVVVIVVVAAVAVAVGVGVGP
ncbi:unnamed protein product [Polarella glacialis]|uniref:Uncharacterized protein n=1 Tax=Polarella glacialis TaxID=89957 RepID=A0A813HTX0_POLGL|nr:unnamed protein product [Polarella glacialis]